MRINGYRYYEDPQIGTMLLIGRLKRYGFSLYGNPGSAYHPGQQGIAAAAVQNKDSAWSG